MGITAQDAIRQMQSWIGTDKRKIIDLYNSYKPLAQGYSVKYTDAWCDTTISALFIKLGDPGIIGGTECGVERHISLFKKAGIWEEDGGVVPEPGWIVCYNWDDATQPNDGFADHIGLVESVSGSNVSVIEGNYNDAVRRRTVPVGWGYIRGYAKPKYAAESQKVEPVKSKYLNGIDISSYQSDIDAEKIAADFIIVKATQGTTYTNPAFRTQIDGAIRGGKIVGLYHYATGAGVNAEVDYFLNAIRDYIGKAFLCLDWETSSSSIGKNTQFKNPAYAKQFMDLVKQRTGLTMFIYGSKQSCFNYMDWSAVKNAGYPCWGAQYKDYMPIYGYADEPWQNSASWGPWGKDVAIHQYTSVLHLPGYGGNLDGNICYLTADELKAYTTSNSIRYRAHCQTIGWTEWVSNGELAGTTGRAKRLEALVIDPPSGVVLEVDVHLQTTGWKTYTGIMHGNSIILGSVGESRRMEAIRIRCIKNPTGKKLKYQVHVQTYGWQLPCSEGETAGTTGICKRLEAIKIWFE